ncbi:MAG: sigma-70 family RNA polymerase sigma factor [Bryobacterales bacterium]|nr:sigma-70 family RNA polymerase sigma factor [Bryobacterales bacterium]
MEPVPRDDLFEWLYGEMRKLARLLLRRERRGHTLTPTDLTHMAMMHLFRKAPQFGADRKGFLLIATKVMRQLLVDYARAYKAQKRSGTQTRVEFDENLISSEATADLILAINEALEKLSKKNPVGCQVVQLHFYSGHTFEEIGDILDISGRTAKRYWTLARLDLHEMLDGKLAL